MALPQATITFDPSDYTSVDFDPRRTKVYATNTAENGVIHDTLANRQYIGSGNGVINTDGSGSITVPAPGEGSNPSDWQTWIHFDVPDRNAHGGRKRETFGPFSITGSATLSSLVEQQEVPPTYLTQVTIALDEKVASAASSAAIATAAADSATAIAIGDADAALTAVATDTGSDFYAAQSATFAPSNVVAFVPNSIVGDGTTNASTPLQAQIDAVAAAGGGRVVLSRGKIYAIDAPLRMKSRVTLDLNGSTLRSIAGSVKAGIIVTQGVDTANSSGGDATTVVADAVIENGTLDNQGTSADGSGKTYAMIYVQRASRLIVRGCRFVNVGSRQGIRFDKITDSCVARDNYVEMPLDNPYLTLTNAQGISCSSTMVDAYAGGNNDAQLFTEPTDVSRRHTIQGNTVIGGTHGVVLAGAQQCVVTGNVLQDNSHRGVIMSPVASRNSITGNVIRDFGSAAILMAFGSYRNTVSGNTCTTTKSVGECDGIRTSYGAVDNLIQGNTVYGATNRGLFAFTGAQRNSFIGNKVTTCGTGIKIWSLETDAGYFQPTSTAHMESILVSGNTFYACTTGISLVQGTTTVAATTSGIPILLRRVAVSDNFIANCTTGITWAEDTPSNMSLVSILGNAFENNTTNVTATRGTFPLGSIHGNSGIFTGSKTWAPGAIAAGTAVTTTVTVTGVRGGDQASSSMSQALAAGIVMTATVSANDTVTVTLFNGTAGSITPTSSTLRVHAWKL